jgi:IS66 C-terminal element
MSEVGKTPIPRGAEEEGLNNQVVPLKSPVDPPPCPNAAEIHGFCAAVPEVRIHLPPAESRANFRLGRKNYLFADSDAGGRRAAHLDPQNYLADVLARIADHPARRISELLPWNWTPAPAKLAA